MIDNEKTLGNSIQFREIWCSSSGLTMYMTFSKEFLTTFA